MTVQKKAPCRLVLDEAMLRLVFNCFRPPVR